MDTVQNFAAFLVLCCEYVSLITVNSDCRKYIETTDELSDSAIGVM